MMRTVSVVVQQIAHSPYGRLARLDRPVGTYLLIWPGYFSLALASSGSLPDPVLLAKFGIGAFVMRSAGCTINDIWDREYDKQVARTKTRPLASGDVTLPGAVAFLGAQLSVGLGILLSLNPETIAWGAVSVIPVCLYPLAKRFVSFPQMVLGLTFNWGAMLGWLADQGSIDWNIILPLYLGCATWTLGYDTIYAHQDKHDDKRIGLKSSALTIGDDMTKLFLSGTYLYSVSCIAGAGFKYAEVYGHFDPWVYSIGVGGMAVNLAYQVAFLNINHTENTAWMFRVNHLAGPCVFGGIVLGKLLA